MSFLPPLRGAVSSLGIGAAPRGRLRRFAILAAWIGASVWTWHWVSTDDQGEPVTQNSDEPSLQVDNLKSFLVRRDGQPLWEINAKHVEMSGDHLSTRLTGVDKGILYRGGKPYINLAATVVKLTNATNDLEATGQVKATGPDGFSIETTRSYWMSRSQIVDCPKPVTAKLRGATFRSKNLKYDWGKGLLTSPGQVEVRVQGGMLHGKNLIASLKSKEVRLSGGVHAVFDPHHFKLPPPAPNLLPSSASPIHLADFNPAVSSSQMRFHLHPALSLSLASGAILLTAHAQPVKPKIVSLSAQKSATPEPDGHINFNSKSTVTNGNGVTQGIGDVTVSQDGQDFILYAQKATYDKKIDQAVASGNLRIETRDSTVYGSSVRADFKAKTLTLIGNVVINTHGKGDGITGNRKDDSTVSQLRNRPSKITCDQVVWNYEDHQAVGSGNIKMTQDESSGTCTRLEYDEAQNVADLLGSVRFTDAQGRVFTTPKGTFYIDSNTFETAQTTLKIPVTRQLGAKPQAPKATPKPKKAPTISDDDIKQFDVPVRPIPTLGPEPTEAPDPPVVPNAKPTEAPTPAK